MANEVKTCSTHPASMAERIKKRLDHSGGGPGRAGETVTVGSGPTRTITAVHKMGMKQGNVRQKDGDR
jgi:hypothetical protein